MAEEASEKGTQFIEDLKDTAKNRLSNPVFFSYLFSWIVCNWTFISFMMFSNKTIEDKLKSYGTYIDFLGWVYPIIGVLIYLVLLNYIDGTIFRLSKHGYQKKIDSWKERVNMKTHAEVEITKKKIELQNKQIEAEKIEVVIEERDRIRKLLDEREKEIRSLNAKISKHAGPTFDSLTNRVDYIQKINPKGDAKEMKRLLETLRLTHEFLILTNNLSQNFVTMSDSSKDNILVFTKLGLLHDNSNGITPIFPQLTELGKATLALL